MHIYRLCILVQDKLRKKLWLLYLEAVMACLKSLYNFNLTKIEIKLTYEGFFFFNATTFLQA